MSAAGALPISVVIPTIGRTELLSDCLESIRSCRPEPAEVLVVDQSTLPAVARTIERFGARRVPCAGRGIPLAVNTGVRAAAEELVAITHDDCTVETDWAAAAAQYAAADADAVVTGMVVAGGDPRLVPSCRERPQPWVFREGASYGALLANNMASQREAYLGFGGFDERFDTVGEDLDFAHRWTRGARTIRYEPAIRVTHHHRRPPGELGRTYREYARGAGLFYSKHLLAGDREVLRPLREDARDYAAALASGARRGRLDPTDHRLGFFPGTIVGLCQGVARFR